MGNPNVFVGDLSIQIADRKFVVLQMDWDDTPKERIDYYSLSASLSDRPKDVRVKEILDGKKLSYFWDSFHFELEGLQKISKLTLLEFTEKGDAEQVRYDAGLLIEFGNGKQLSIIRDYSVHGGLVISHTPTNVADSVAALRQRIVFPI